MRSFRNFGRITRSLLLGAGALIACGALPPAITRALAQAPVSVTISPQRGTAQETFQLEVVVSDRSQIGSPQFETSNEFTLEPRGTSTRRQYLNGVSLFQVAFSFEVIPDPDLKPGTYRLPAGKIAVGNEILSLPGPTVVITPGSTAGGASPVTVAKASDVAFAQYVTNTNPYVGQQILYRVEIASNQQFLGGNLEEIEPKGFWREKLGDGEREERQAGAITIRSFNEVLIPTKTGELEIPPRTLQARLRRSFKVPRSRRSQDPFEAFFQGDPFSSFFERYQTAKKTLTAPAVKINARPLPPRPSWYKGYVPVGTVSVKASAVPGQVREGESINLTLVMTGTANLRPLELPEPGGDGAKDFRLYPEKADTTTVFKNDRLVFTKTFKAALVPLRAGNLTIPIFRLLTFDPEQENYREIASPPLEVEVLPGDPGQTTLEIAGKPEQLARLQIPATPVEQPQAGEADLRPQRAGAAALHTRLKLSRNFVLTVLLLLPLICLAIERVLRQRLQFAADPALLLQRSAYQNALRELGSLDSASRDAAAETELIHRSREVLIAYLEQRLRMKLHSLTPREAGDAIRPHLHQQEIAGRLERQLEDIQTALYAGAQVASGTAAKLTTETAQLVKEIERGLR